MLRTNIKRLIAQRSRVSTTVIKKLFHSDIPYTSVGARPCEHKVAELKHKSEKVTRELMSKYPNILQHEMSGTIVYTVQAVSPEVFVKNGGFSSRLPVYVSFNEHGQNEGSVCFSILPQAALIFTDKAKFASDNRTAYIYATTINGKAFLPGGAFCQVITPGAFPMPSWWLARKVVDFKNNGEAVLGEMVGQSHSNSVMPNHDDCFKKYCAGKLFKPAVLSFGEDHPPEFEIEHTTSSKAFQEMVASHYKKMMKL